MEQKIESVWAVEHSVNPHRPSHGSSGIVVIYANKKDAENFIALHPQYHYKLGLPDPRTILELKELPIGQVADWWRPTFP